MKKINLNENRGLTLIEIVVSLAIMSITFVTFMSLFYQSSQITGDNSKKTDMVTVAQELMEKASKVDGYATLSLSANLGQVNIPSNQIGDIYSRYQADRTVSVIASGLIRVTIRVWDGTQPQPIDRNSGVILVTMLSNA